MGAFTLLRFDDHPDLYYSEDYDSGYMTANPAGDQGTFGRLRSPAGRRLEVARLTPHVAVRDLKNPAGPHVTVSSAPWAVFLDALK